MARLQANSLDVLVFRAYIPIPLCLGYPRAPLTHTHTLYDTTYVYLPFPAVGKLPAPPSLLPLALEYINPRRPGKGSF